MPRKGSPYGERAYLQYKAALAKTPRLCAVCGLRRGTEPDHVPPVGGHDHRRVGLCCRLQPACGECQRLQGARLAGSRSVAPAGEEFVEPVGIEQGDPVWDVPWLEVFHDVPEDATWPRFMTVPHPSAVGSYGEQAIEWVSAELGVDLRWWQRLAITRELEYDSDGRLVWLTVLRTTARQVGKSTLLRGQAGWRMHQRELFGEPQELLHTGKDLPVCRQVITPMMAWAEVRGEDAYAVRRQNGNEAITHLASGSRWIVRGKGSVYGYSGSAGFVDEAWGVDPEVVDDGILPTMLERESPQLLLTSTAHRKATALFMARRMLALADLREPRKTLLLEWSAPRSAEVGDEFWWRMASPHWGVTRQAILEDSWRRVQMGKSLDPDELDPVESFRAQYLNQWPTSMVSQRGEALFAPDVWESAEEDVDVEGPLVLAVEDWYGHGAGAAAAAVDDDGRVVVGGWCFDSRQAAYDWVQRWCEKRSGSLVLVGRTLVDDPGVEEMSATVEPRGGSDTSAGLSLLRQLVAAGGVVHDGSADVRLHVAAARVSTGSGGALSLVESARPDLVRAVVWAAAEAYRGGGPQVFGGSL